mgnify:CR=1 FL=1
MKVFLRPLVWLYKIYFALYFSITLVLFYPFFRLTLSKAEGYPVAFKVMRFFSKIWLFFSGIFLKIKGKKNIIKSQPFLICANHSSFIDIPCIYAVFDEYFVFTGKKEIEKWPLFNIFYTSGMNILVDRDNKKGALKGFKRMLKVIEEKYPLAIFPEGTISKTAPKLTDFKTGAVKLAIQKQVPILPITFTTNWKRLQRKGFWSGLAGPGVSEMIIHPPISTEGITKADTTNLLNQLKNIINTPLKKKYGL